jgi:hypothetical protein
MGEAESRRGRSSKQKGARYERLIAEAVAEWLGLPTSDVFRTRTGSNKEDIGLSEEAARRFPFSIEAKHHKSLKLPEWIKQASTNAAKVGRKPVVVFRASRDRGSESTDYVCLTFFDFMEIVTRVLNYERNQ